MLKSKGEVSVKKIITLVFTVFIVIMMIALSGQIFETNKAGHFQVKQAALSGDMSVKLESGTYLQMFGNIDTYKNVATIGFGEKNEGDGSTDDIDGIDVIFNDGSKAFISGVIRVKLPTTIEGALKLKSEYAQGYDHFIRSGIVPIVSNAVKLSANLRSAQDAYTTLALFQQAIED